MSLGTHHVSPCPPQASLPVTVAARVGVAAGAAAVTVTAAAAAVVAAAACLSRDQCSFQQP